MSEVCRMYDERHEGHNWEVYSSVNCSVPMSSEHHPDQGIEHFCPSRGLPHVLAHSSSPESSPCHWKSPFWLLPASVKVCLFMSFIINGILQCVVLCSWLLSLNIMSRGLSSAVRFGLRTLVELKRVWETLIYTGRQHTFWDKRCPRNMMKWNSIKAKGSRHCLGKDFHEIGSFWYCMFFLDLVEGGFSPTTTNLVPHLPRRCWGVCV